MTIEKYTDIVEQLEQVKENIDSYIRIITNPYVLPETLEFHHSKIRCNALNNLCKAINQIEKI